MLGGGASPYDLPERESARRASVFGKAGRCQRCPAGANGRHIRLSWTRNVPRGEAFDRPGQRKGQYISLKDLLQEVQVQGDRADRQNRETAPQD